MVVIDQLQQVLNLDQQTRLFVFLAVILSLMLLERAWPKRDISRAGGRWSGNLLLALINTAVLMLVPMSMIKVAQEASWTGSGLLYQTGLDLWPKIWVSILILDLVVYWQHRLFHRWVFWRAHRVHHIDHAVDVTTALRFHPVEIVLSMLLKCTVVWVLGVPPLGVLVFEILLNAAAMFNHSNLRLPRLLDRILRLVIVTPDMHRVHHSQRFEEHNSNYGFFLSFWDRLFFSYRAQSKAGDDFSVGLKTYEDRRYNGLIMMLLNPFKSENDARPRDGT